MRSPLALLLTACLACSASETFAQAAALDVATYTREQAERGRAIYATHCTACHGMRLESGTAPALVGTFFRQKWSRTRVNVDDLYFIVSTTMPPQQANVLSETDYLEVMAFILAENGVPAGSEPLRAEYLGSIQLPQDDITPAPAFLAGKRKAPIGQGPTQDDLLEARPENWLYHTRNYAGTRYSPLAQIDRSNVSRLQVRCLYQLGEAANFQTGPVVHDGILYLTGNMTTVAIDAATCRQIWRHTWNPLDRGVWMRNRGVAVKDGYVVRGTDDGYLIALDAADGALLWGRQVADPWLGETFTMAPMIYEDAIFIGPAGSENAISGWVGAFRLSDGEPIWRFQTVPGATRSGGETWGNPEGIVIGGGAVWTPFSLDPDRGELYVAVTNPAPDFAAELRPGANLYTNSIISLDVRTGELNWYDQLVPADEHDWDLTQVSPVYETLVDGGVRRLIATAGKDGLLRVLDRDALERVFASEVARRENVDAPVTPEGTYACPGTLGGVEWNGPALHPGENLLITPAGNRCMTFYQAQTVRYVNGQLYMGGETKADSIATGWLTAVDAGDGSFRWRYESTQPMVAAVTTTAGGLVLTGELTGDFLVLDAASGEPLYRFNTGGPIGGGVVSYGVGGRQYIAVASGNPSSFWVSSNAGSATIVVFALPED